MRFKDLFCEFAAGTPIKRKLWDGYWIYRNDRVQVHKVYGDISDFNEDAFLYIGNMMMDDWEIATTENCILLMNEMKRGSNRWMEVKKPECVDAKLREYYTEATESLKQKLYGDTHDSINVWKNQPTKDKEEQQ